MDILNNNMIKKSTKQQALLSWLLQEGPWKEAGKGAGGQQILGMAGGSQAGTGWNSWVLKALCRHRGAGGPESHLQSLCIIFLKASPYICYQPKEEKKKKKAEFNTHTHTHTIVHTQNCADL